MTASIIICTRNRAEYLLPTLQSLGGVQVPSALSVELWVVDNGSTDRTEEVVKSLRLPNVTIRYACEPQPGRSRALNRTLARAAGDIILHSDDDVRFPPTWIEAMCAPILEARGQAVGGGIRIAPHLKRGWMTAKHQSWFGHWPVWETETTGVMIGANFAVGRQVLQKVPAFDVELGPGTSGFGDDVLFSWQVQQAGYRILSAPIEACVEHHFDPSRLLGTALIQRAEQEGKSEAYLAYHWLHSSPRHLRARQQLHTARLQLLRRRQGQILQDATEEGCSDAELDLITKINYVKQYQIEQKRARNYDLHGLTRIDGKQ